MRPPDSLPRTAVPDEADRRSGRRRLGVAAVQGVAWMGTAQGVRIPLQIGIFAIMARMLQPEDFGLFGMVALLVDLLYVVPGFGVTATIVSDRDLDEEDVSTLFWWQTGVGVLMTAVTILAAPLVSELYGEPRLTGLTKLLALSFLMAPPGMVAMGWLEKRLAFSRLAMLEVSALALAGAVSVGMALRGWGAVSLVLFPMATLAFQSVFALVAARWVPRFCFRWSVVSRAMGFGVGFTGVQVLYYLTRQLDSVLVGRYLGAAMLGYYTLAYRFILHVTHAVAGVVVRVMFPIIASIQNRPDHFREAYLRALSGVATLLFPVLSAVFVSAGDIVRIVFGDAWQPLVPLVRIFCVIGMFQCTMATTGPVFWARRRMGLLLVIMVVAVPVVGIPVGVGLRWGVGGVAVALLGASVVVWTMTHGVANRILGLSPRRFFRALVWPAVFMVTVGIVSAAVQQVLGTGEARGLDELVLVVGMGLAAGVAVLWFGRAPVIADVVALGRGVLRGQG